MTQPLILTLQIDPEAQDFYETLRQRYFPPELNQIPAHLTIFHLLPDTPATHAIVLEAAQATQAFELTKPTPRSIGRGVAVFFISPAAKSIHKDLAAAFEPHLTRQDSQSLQPHIVVQNKVDPATAKLTLAELQPLPLVVPHAIGLSLWRYLGGPWQHLSNYAFSQPELLH